MPGSWPPSELPYLTDVTCEVTSAASRQYNCIAWATDGDTDKWWWPDPMGVGYWPPGAPRVVTTEAFMRVYEMRGYRLCYDTSLQAGLEKIAIFGKEDQNGIVVPTHAALQLESGEWTSKLGPFEDVRHKTLDAVSGPVYGKAFCYMSRPRRPG
jgi:hypothetical protein